MALVRSLPGADWRGCGLCSQTDPEEFFPEQGGSPQLAVAVCRRCEVSVECLAWALDHDVRFGVWGGRTETERRRLRRAVVQAAAVQAVAAQGGEAA